MAEISLHEYTDKIEHTIEQGRYDQANAHGKHILKQYPKHVGTYRLLGKAMLEAGQDEDAADMFRRVLSVDPEDLVAWVGMSEIHGRRGELDAATWYLERAFEVATDNEVVAEELRRLYGRRDGVEPRQIQLTRGALARLYLKGDLLSRAISEFRALLAEYPDRIDLRVALAEALWRNDQRLEAVEVCQQILDVMPYCLKANLILGEIWASKGHEEAQTYLRRAEAVDPQNHMAQELFGATSPLPAQEVWVTPLAVEGPTEAKRPAWMAGVEAVPAEEPALAEGEMPPSDVAAAAGAQIAIPTWLEQTGGEEAVAPPPPTPEEPPALVEEKPPAWMAGVGPEPPGEEKVAEPLIPLGFEPAGVGEAPTIPVEETMEWLAEPEAETVSEEGPPSPPMELPPDWLAGIRELFAAEAETPGEPAAPIAEEAPLAEERPPTEETPLPPWLEEGGAMPTGDEALAWLGQLAAGKEEQLRAQAQAEVELRMAEVMGRPAPAEAPPVEVAPEEVTPPVEEAAPAPAEEPFGWTPFEQPQVPSEAITAVEEAPPVAEAPAPEEMPLPAWLEEGAAIPSGDEALAWLGQLAAGKEEQLRAQAQAEVELRMAEVMGRPAPAEAPPVEVAPEEVTPPVEEAAPAPAEEPFGWTLFEEPQAPPEAITAVEEVPPEAPLELEEEGILPTPVVEEVPGMAEMEVPVPLEAPIVPPEPLLATAPVEPFATERTYLKAHPRDYEGWLALARALWQAGQRDEALEAYSRLIRPGRLLDGVIADLEGYVRQRPDVSLQRVLGDAYMKVGRLQEALSLYRRALETL